MSYQEEKLENNNLSFKNNFLGFPLVWFAFILFLWLIVNLNLVSIKSLAISSQTLKNPFSFYTIFTAGISHKSFIHLGVNLVFLVGLFWLTQKEKIYSFPSSFVKLALLINIIQGLLLSLFLLSENSFQKYIYGSSGIICGIISFLVFRLPKNKQKNIFLLRMILIFIVIFSLMDIFISPYFSLGSLSHLLGVLAGVLLSFMPFQKEVFTL